MMIQSINDNNCEIIWIKLLLKFVDNDVDNYLQIVSGSFIGAIIVSYERSAQGTRRYQDYKVRIAAFQFHFVSQIFMKYKNKNFI